MEKFWLFWHKFNHSIITAVVLVPAVIFNIEVEVLFFVTAFWFGREHSQAEYRYMNIHNITREDLGFFDGFSYKAWNKESLYIDLLLPILIGNLILIIIKRLGGIVD